MATAAKKNQPAPTQTVVTVTFADGSQEDYPLSPLTIYRANKLGHEGAISLTFAAAWLAAGEPDGSIEGWLGRMVDITEAVRPVPLENGKQP